MQIDLSAPGVGKALSKKIKEDIDAACVSLFDDGHRKHLGASLIGDECWRKLWYSFRWFKKETFDGRQLRLFNRGHREEARFEEWIKAAGFNALTHDPETGNQFRIEGVMGHFGGSLDGIAALPESYGIPGKFLLEFKTNGTGKGFADLLAQGMKLAKPQHYAQTSVYGYKMGFSHVVYLNICKNDDNLHAEFVELDHKLGAQMEVKAERIIVSREPMPKLSENPTFHKCNYCYFKPICHFGAEPERNCRSCIYSKPIENKQWQCEFYNGTIPEDFIPKGCENWKNANVSK